MDYILGVGIIYKLNQRKSMKNALEIVIYKIQEGVTDEDFIKAAGEMEENFAKKQEGFIKRTFAKSENGDWIDVLYWETMDNAMRASEEAMKSPACAPMFGMLDSENIKMHHFEILS